MRIKTGKVSYDIADRTNRPTMIGPGVAVPRAFTAHLELDDGIALVMQVEVIDRVPRCVEVVVRNDSLQSGDLRLPVQRLLDIVVSMVATNTTTSGGVMRAEPPATDKDARTVVEATQTATRRRRHITDDLLTRAADAYRDGGIESVRAVLAVSEATAYRYVRKARDQNLLERREDEQ